MRVTLDIESSGLLDNSSIDYTSSPYKLKDSFRVWCVVCHDIDNNETYRFENEEVKTKFPEFSKKLDTIIVHNGIDFDLLVLKLFLGLNYTIEPDTFDGRPVEIIDTLIISKCLNPDRFGGHSLDEWGQRVGYHKIDWRKEAIELGLISSDAPKGAEFLQWHPKMGDYCVRDTEVTKLTYFQLLKEIGDWPWADAISLEKSVAEIVTRSKHRGFYFNKELAEWCVRDLDDKITKLKELIEPILPTKPLTKAAQKLCTPPAKQYNLDGSHSANFVKFINKNDGEFINNEEVFLLGKKWKLPLPVEPLIKEIPCTLKDTTSIKEWLVSMGWQPIQYKEKDLTCNTKKIKLTPEQYQKTAEKYIQQTLNSHFCKDRCEQLKTTPSGLRDKILKHDLKKPLKVYTNPSFTIGQEKEICPNLLLLKDKFPYAQDIVHFLTYQHRRNSILGGGMDLVDEDDYEGEEEYQKGYLANIRDDGRISTPADTCGAGTSRFKHKVVANIPRITSLYGNYMRALFGTSDNFIQIGYDFDSLEARVEAHYVHKYPKGKEYGISLIAKKPNDCHTVLAKRISSLLNRDFPRGTAKNVKYGCLPTDNTEILTEKGWRKYADISINDRVFGYNTEKECLELTDIDCIHFYHDAYVVDKGHTNWHLESTLDHRWYGERLKQYGGTKYKHTKVWEKGFSTTQGLKQTFNILNTSEFLSENSRIVDAEAAFIGWLLSDGYYKWSKLSETTSCSGGKRKGIVSVIAQSINKYWQELEKVLDTLGLTYYKDTRPMENGNDIYRYRISGPDLRSLIDRVVGSRLQKHDVDWVSWVISLSSSARRSFLKAFWYADGNTKVSKDASYILYKQNEGKIRDALMVAGFLCGYNVSASKTTKCGDVRFQIKRQHTTTQEFRDLGNRTTDVFCLTTPLDTFVVRQNGIITITGNCSYNAQPPRLAKTIGCDLETATLVFDTFWQQAAPLKQLKENMIRYWETTGQKKFLIGIDKRKLPIRAKGNVINTAFQSCGVICAKRAMVLHDRKLQAEGLITDFFTEDWKNKDFCQQMIGYHDEAQLEVPKRLVSMKVIKTEKDIDPDHLTEYQEKAEEILKNWKKQQEQSSGKIFSDIGHKDNYFYVGYCRAGELAIQSVVEAGRYYHLNIDLSSSYVLGRNWKDCH